MQITHQQAHSLVQFALDGRVDIHQRQLLDSHLASCGACRHYADSIHSMDSALRPFLQRQWNRQPVPLPISVLTSRSFPKTSDGMVVATRIAAIGVLLVAFLFGAWQLTLSKSISASPVAASIPVIPTPSTSTELAAITQTQTCETTVYIVQPDDTLQRLADQFAVSTEELMSANRMRSDEVQAGMQLLIPACKYTPTANVSTITWTPIRSTTTSTPGG